MATGITEAYLKELAEHQQNYWGKFHNNIREGRDLRFRRHKINVPKAYRASTTEIKSSIVLDMHFRVVATLTTDEPTIKVPPYAQTEKAKDNSNLRERFSLGALEQMMNEVGRDTLRMGVDAAVGDGLGVFKLIERSDAWKGFPRRKPEEEIDDNLSVEDNKARADKYTERSDKFVKGAPFPFIWTDIDPTTYFPLTGAFGSIDEVLEVTKRPAVPTMKQFGVYRPTAKKGFAKRRVGQALTDDDGYASQTFDMREHWTSTGVTYELDNEIVEQRKVSYGRVPYFHFGGHMTSSRKPEEMYQSVTQPFAHLIPALDSLLTMMTNWGFFAAYPFIVQDPNEPQIMGPRNPAKTVFDITPGSILRGVRFLEAPQTSKALADLIGLLNQMIDRSGLAAIMYGGGGGATPSSGYLASQLMTAAQLVYSPIVDNVRMALDQMIPFMWKLIEHLKGRTVYVWGNGTSKGQQAWLGLGPEDIDGYYACKTSLKPLLPMDEMGQRDSAARMVQSELWSQRRAMEHIGVEQPEEEQDQILVEKLLKSPKYMEAMMQDAGEKAGLVEPPPTPPETPPGPPTGPEGSGVPMGGGFPAQGPVMPQIPGAPGGLPLVPPAPPGAGMPIVQRQPGGNFGGPAGQV